MSLIPSATTLTVHAYFTELGRSYLIGFGEDGNTLRYTDGIDNLEFTHFSLYDEDVNYYSTSNLETGDLPDITGARENFCLKTVSNSNKKNRIKK